MVSPSDAWLERERMRTMLILSKVIIERFVLLNARTLGPKDKLIEQAIQYLEAKEEGCG